MNFINFVKRSHYKRLFKNNVTQVSIEFNSDCNRKCIYCPHSIMQREAALMPDEILTGVLRQLKSIRYNNFICLNIYNEPLLHIDRLFHVIDRIKTYLPDSKISFSTNGDFLNTTVLNNLAEHKLDMLIVSLHSNHWDPAKTYAAYINLCRRLDVPAPELIGNANGLGANFSIKNMHMRIFSMNYAKVGSTRANLLNTVEKHVNTNRNRACRRPRFEFTIFYDGSVYPCCHFFHGHPAIRRFMIGNVTKKNIFTIYGDVINSDFCAVAELRKKDMEPCISCNEV